MKHDLSKHAAGERDNSLGALLGPDPGVADWKAASRAARALAGTVALAHLVAFILFVQWIAPRPEDAPEVVYGTPEYVVSGSARTVEHWIRVGGRDFGCVAAAVGASYSCPKAFQEGVPARITYFQSRTVESRLGLVDRPLVVVGIEQAGTVVYSRSSDQIRSVFYWSGLFVPISVFGVSLLLCVRFILRRGAR
jgi:hypothetical protein